MRNDFKVFLPHGYATKIIYECTQNVNAQFYAEYTLKDTLHRKGPTSRRRRMMGQDEDENENEK